LKRPFFKCCAPIEKLQELWNNGWLVTWVLKPWVSESRVEDSIRDCDTSEMFIGPATEQRE
jgi:hypothetical protein